MPARLLRSVIAIARWPSAAAVSTSSSGCEAPRRNEKFVVTCSSAYRGSGKDAMDKPARFVVAAVETRPEQPEAPPLLVLDPVVIADSLGGARPLRPPPFLGNPLGSIGLHHSMPAPSPGKMKGRVVRQEPERFDWIWRVEQPDRPQRLIGSRPEGRVGPVNRYPHRCAFRDVALAWLEA